MLNEGDFLGWCRRLALAETTQSAIAAVRSRNPTRRVGGGRDNVSGRFPSRKMGLTIQFESHRVELPLVYEMEHDPGVLEYYDQPPSIPLAYHAANGRSVSVMHTPDYFVIRQDSAGWVECKSSEDLRKLAIRTPNRYLRDGSGKWRCPPGEAHSSPLAWTSGYGRQRRSTGISSETSRSWKTIYDVTLQARRDLSTRPLRLRSKQSRGFSCANCWKGQAASRKLTRFIY